MSEGAELPPGAAARSEFRSTAFFADLATETALLVEQELALFKAELSEKAGQVVRGGILLGAAALTLFAGLLALLAAVVLGLAAVLAPWVAALVVGLTAIVAGAILLILARARLAPRTLVPRRSLASLCEDEAWLREQFR